MFPTQSTKLLNRPSELLKNIDLVVADVDYTFVDFGAAHEAGIKALAKTFDQKTADEVSRLFHLTLEGLRRPLTDKWAERASFDQLVLDIENLHKDFISDYGPRLWSRETWLYLADPKLTVEELTIGRDSYWQGVTEKSEFYADVKEFLGYLKSNQIPLILMTGSDAVLRVANGPVFRYDPEYAEAYKNKRLTILPFSAHAIITGDPVDKPSVEFFDRVFEVVQALGSFPHNQVLFMGDSPRNDLEVPKDLGYRTLLVTRDK